jgi:hypothetical protein
MSIDKLSHDVWARILHFMNDDDRLVEHFDNLYYAGVFGVIANKLDVFWCVTAEAKLIVHKDSLKVEPICEKKYKSCVEQLCEMGINKETSFRVVRESYGDINGAFLILGWL